MNKSLTFLMLVWCAALRVAAAYSYPVGIPDCWIDPTTTPPAAPADWSSEVAGYYYVNNDTGTDSGRTYGRPGAPRATIPNPIPAGSRVEVHGTYDATTGGDVRINGAGTGDAWAANSAGPCWIIGIDGDRPVFTGGKVLAYGTYVYFYNTTHSGITSGATFQVSSGSVGFSANHIALLSCDIEGTTTGGVGVGMAANSGSPVTNVLIYNSTIHDLGPTDDSDQDSHAVSVGSYYTNVWVLSNTISNSSGSGMQVAGASPPAAFVYVGSNAVSNCRQAGLWVKYGEDVIISGNTIEDIQDRCVGADTSPSKALGGQYHPVRVWWINNIVRRCRYGIRVPSVNTGNTEGEFYAIGNLFEDMDIAASACFDYPDGSDSWAMAAVHWHGGTTRYFCNNTIVNASSGIHISRASDSETVIENNIIENINHSNGFFLFAGETSNLTFTTNILHTQTADAVKWSATEYATVAAWQSAVTGEGVGCSTSDPLFVSSSDYQLQSGSPAVGASALPAVLAIFESYYGISIDSDLIGTTRPQGGTWDIGAYEYTPGSRRATLGGGAVFHNATFP